MLLLLRQDVLQLQHLSIVFLTIFVDEILIRLLVIRNLSVGLLHLDVVGQVIDDVLDQLLIIAELTCTRKILFRLVEVP